MASWKKLTFYVGSGARWKSQSLDQAIVELARDQGLFSLVVTQGLEGFGPQHLVQPTGIISRAADLPIVIQIIDSEEAINQFLVDVQPIAEQSIITVDDVNVVYYPALPDKI